MANNCYPNRPVPYQNAYMNNRQAPRQVQKPMPVPQRMVKPAQPATMMQNPRSKAQLLKYISEVSFAVTDIALYLDTHPEDKEALAYFKEHSKKRNEALKEYAQCYGPITVDTANDAQCDSWEWVNQPWPWEDGG